MWSQKELILVCPTTVNMYMSLVVANAFRNSKIDGILGGRINLGGKISQIVHYEYWRELKAYIGKIDFIYDLVSHLLYYIHGYKE
jgi:hypothetical protein